MAAPDAEVPSFGFYDTVVYAAVPHEFVGTLIDVVRGVEGMVADLGEQFYAFPCPSSAFLFALEKSREAC